MSVNEKMTAIADAIREKTGGTEALTLDGMAEAIPEVYDAGKQSEYDKFWDAYQENGKRLDWRNAFGGDGWNAETFKPKYPIVVGSIYQAASSMFTTFNRSRTQSGIQTFPSPVDMTEACKMINFSKATGLEGTFSNARAINITIDATSCTTMGNCFAATNGGYHDYITIKNLTEKCANFSNTFIYNSVLKEIRFENSVIAGSIDLHWSPLTYESLMSIIDALQNLRDTGKTLTLTLGTENLAKLTDADKAIATEKGWTLA